MITRFSFDAAPGDALDQQGIRRVSGFVQVTKDVHEYVEAGFATMRPTGMARATAEIVILASGRFLVSEALLAARRAIESSEPLVDGAGASWHMVALRQTTSPTEFAVEVEMKFVITPGAGGAIARPLWICGAGEERLLGAGDS